MKALSRGLAAFLLLMSAALASAKTVDLSYFAEGEGWQKFSAALVADKLMVAGADRFQTAGITNTAYQYLSPAEQATVSRVGLHALAMKEGLPTEMTLTEWKTVAPNFTLPPVQIVAKAAATTPTTSVAEAQPAPQVQAAPAAPTVTAENVKRELDALSKSIDPKQGEINRQVAVLKKQLSTAVTKSEVARIVAETQQIRDLTARMVVVEKDVKLLKDVQTRMDGQLSGLKGALEHPETGLTVVGNKADMAFRMATAAVDDLKKVTATLDDLKSVNQLWWWMYGFIAVLLLLAVVAFRALSRANLALTLAGTYAGQG